ncbi:DUF2226 domain-containing protein [bacterium]|nr:DUF2226 domain-containing protein [Methanomicrobia archaeon]MCD6148799.1 DUF2226 domain-containing protein [bacterium]HDM22319.1 DUF2226 domain-containing protein [Methanomicrobia archaeon]
MELPRGTSIYYSEREKFVVSEDLLENINPDFKGYVRIFGKNNTVEDIYLLIKNKKIIAADVTNLATNQVFKGDEAMAFLDGRRYETAVVEFMRFDDFMFDVALEVNEDCTLKGKKISKEEITKKKIVSPKKLDREALLKKYRIKVPTDETIIKLFGEKNEKIIALEEECKSELLNNIKRGFFKESMFDRLHLEGFEAFLRENSVFCNVKINYQCFVLHLKDGMENTFRERIEKITEDTIKEKMKKLGLDYKLSLNLVMNLKLCKT